MIVSESRSIFHDDLEQTQLEGLGFEHPAQDVDAPALFFAQSSYEQSRGARAS